MNRWVVLDLDFAEEHDIRTAGAAIDEAIRSLDRLLSREGAAYYMADDPDTQSTVLIVPSYYIDGRNSMLDQYCEKLGLIYSEVEC